MLAELEVIINNLLIYEFCREGALRGKIEDYDKIETRDKI